MSTSAFPGEAEAEKITLLHPLPAVQQQQQQYCMADTSAAAFLLLHLLFFHRRSCSVILIVASIPQQPEQHALFTQDLRAPSIASLLLHHR